MLPLPILNVRLRACAEDWAQMTPTQQGHHCAHCDRVVINFTQATPADLDAAFQASPDGRVCGRFQLEQLAPNQPAPIPRRVALRPKLRRFLVALLLVCGLGLGAREAVAQVRQVVQTVPPKPRAYSANQPYGAVMEQMPVYKDGGNEGIQRLIAKNLRQPHHLTENGRVFVEFTVDKTGIVRDAKVRKAFRPDADAEALRVVGLLGPWIPGYQNGRAVPVKYTLPITFNAK